MAYVSLELSISCKDCGADLDVSDDAKRGVQVEPCPACMKSEKEAGHEAGHAEGLKEGREETRAEEA